MTTSPLDRARRLIDEHGARLVDLKVVDLLGRLRHVTIPADALDEALMERGVGFDGSSYGFRKVEASDMVLLPDAGSAHLDPFREDPVISVFASVHLADPGLPVADQDTRGVLLRALERMRGLGVADDLLVAPEYEFYLFRDMDAQVGCDESYVRVDAEERWDVNTYHLANPADVYADVRDRAVRMLMDLGMPVKYHHHETGGRGQQEIEFTLGPADSAGDHALLVKYVLHNLARREGLRATFMPKPLHGQPGTGWHVHQQLRAGETNLFWDPEGVIGLSRLALQYTGGLLLHGRALSGLLNPSTSSYKRLNSGFEAPVSLTFGPANRTAAVRIPRWARGADTRIELRSGDLMGNPHLSLAAMLMAGLDGIERGIDPVAEGYGPAETLAPGAAPVLPRSLDDALDALDEDRAFLERGGVFPPSLLDQWIDARRSQAAAVAEQPHPAEFVLYFDS